MMHHVWLTNLSYTALFRGAMQSLSAQARSLIVTIYAYDSLTTEQRQTVQHAGATKILKMSIWKLWTINKHHL